MKKTGFILSEFSSNEVIAQALAETLRWIAGPNPKSAPFGSLSSAARLASAHAFDHPAFEALGAAFTDGRHIFVSSRALAQELGRASGGDPMASVCLRALALMEPSEAPFESRPDIQARAGELAELSFEVALVPPRLVAQALETHKLVATQAALGYPSSESLEGVKRLFRPLHHALAQRRAKRVPMGSHDQDLHELPRF